MPTTADVTDNSTENQFELVVDGEKALAAYRLQDGRISFTHTEVPETLEGQGIGKMLVAGALDQVRARGLRVVPLCAFVRHYIETHEDVQDLVA